MYRNKKAKKLKINSLFCWHLESHRRAWFGSGSDVIKCTDPRIRNTGFFQSCIKNQNLITSFICSAKNSLCNSLYIKFSTRPINQSPICSILFSQPSDPTMLRIQNSGTGMYGKLCFVRNDIRHSWYQCCGSGFGAFFTPGSGINNPDHIPRA